MNKSLVFVSGCTLGLGTMYFTDPQRGRRRRAVLRDKAVHWMHESQHGLSIAGRDLTHRGKGVFAQSRSRIAEFGKPVDDDVLVSRVRARLGRLVEHPSLVEAAVHDGSVLLSGQIAEYELHPLLQGIDRVHGVKQIENHLKIMEPGTRSVARRVASRSSVSPSTRLLGGASAAFCLGYALYRRDLPGLIAGVFGGFLFSRALAGVNIPREIALHRSVHIRAPIEKVFEFWSDLSNFPRLLKDVKEVTTSADGRSHWAISGPAGSSISWDCITHEHRPQELIAWKSVPGALIENRGRIRFFRDDQGGTRVDLEIGYHPPAGVLGHFAAILFGANPKSKLDNSLAQIKMILEGGSSVETHLPV